MLYDAGKVRAPTYQIKAHPAVPLNYIHLPAAWSSSLLIYTLNETIHIAKNNRTLLPQRLCRESMVEDSA